MNVSQNCDEGATYEESLCSSRRRRGGGELLGMCSKVMDMIRTTAISGKGLVALAFLTSSLHAFY